MNIKFIATILMEKIYNIRSRCKENYIYLQYEIRGISERSKDKYRVWVRNIRGRLKRATKQTSST